MVDNGKDYDARVLQGMTKAQRRTSGGSGGSGGAAEVTDSAARLAGVFPILGVGVRHVLPYHGQSKPIERFFGTVADRFARLFETYCGHKPDAKPEDLQHQLELGAAPELAEFARDFADWLEHDYHLRDGHAGQGMDGRSPAEVYAACLSTKRAATPEQLHFACMPRFGPVRVGQHGVTYKGLNFGAYSPEVAGLFGRRVFLAVDLDDLSRVVLVSEEGRMLCLAPANERLPVNANAQDLRAALGEKRKTRRVVAEYHQRRTRVAEDTRDAVLRAARERSAAAAPAGATSGGDQPPPSVSPVRTPYDDQLRQLAKLRPAVGLESVVEGPVRFPGRPEADDGPAGSGGIEADDSVSFRDLARAREEADRD